MASLTRIPIGSRDRQGARSYQLETQLRAQLHAPPAAGAGDVAVVGILDVGVRIAELGRVGDAERFSTQFHPDLLGEAEDLKKGGVRVEEVGTGENVAARGTEAHSGGLHEAGQAEPGAAAFGWSVDAVEFGDLGHLVG